MNRYNFYCWYNMLGRDAAEAAADFFGVPLKVVAKWEEEYRLGESTSWYPAQVV